MELRQLEYFVAVAEEASFTRAAERVLVAQSGVSAQVRGSSASSGQELLERGARTVTLTEAGAAVLPFARDALAAVAGARAAVEELTGPAYAGTYASGMVTAGPGGHADRACSRLPPRAPGGRDHALRGRLEPRCWPRSATGRSTSRAPRSGPSRRRASRSQVIIDEAIVAAVAPSHPLATRASLTLDGARRAPADLPPARDGHPRDPRGGAACAPGSRSRPAITGVLAQLAARGLGRRDPARAGRNGPAHARARAARADRAGLARRRSPQPRGAGLRRTRAE